MDTIPRAQILTPHIVASAMESVAAAGSAAAVDLVGVAADLAAAAHQEDGNHELYITIRSGKNQRGYPTR